MGQKLFCKLMEINFQYIFITALINLVSFTDDCFLNDNSLLSINFCLYLHPVMFLFFASQTSKTPKKKDRICLATFRLSEELSVLRLWCLVYAPFRELTPCGGFHGFPQRHSRIAGTCRAYFGLLGTAALWEVAGACLLGKPETAHAAQTALQGAYPSKPCKTEFLWKAVVVWRHILSFFLGVSYSVRAKTETQPDAGTLENDG